MEGFVSGVGSVELDNDCQYSIDRRSVRSRESVVPKEDLAFYFKEYIEPKYGLGNINVSNCASFMKDLEMNWSKLTPVLKDKVLSIMVDYILKDGDYDFKNRLLAKLDINTVDHVNTERSTGSTGNKSTFGKGEKKSNKFVIVIAGVVALLLILFILDKTMHSKPASYAKFV